MRELKFRAWDKFKKEMRKVDKMDFHNKKGIIAWFLNGEKILYPKQSTELMQYTGLKDCKGVEIYEGDIVRLVGDLKMLYENFDYYNIISEVIFNNDTISFDALRIAPALNKNNCIFFEVIGNIHQHSEILENLKQPRVFTEMPNF